MSIATRVADALVAELARHTFSLPFEPKMLVLPTYEAAELETLRVTVVPCALEIEKMTRASSKYTVTLDIGVQQRIQGTKEETVANLGELVDEIAEFIKTHELSDMPAAQWVSLVSDPLYVPEHLKQKRAFTGVLSVKYILFD